MKRILIRSRLDALYIARCSLHGNLSYGAHARIYMVYYVYLHGAREERGGSHPRNGDRLCTS